MNLSEQIKTLFTPPVRPHSPRAELSVRTGTYSTKKDFEWLGTNIPCQKACPVDAINLQKVSLSSGPLIRETRPNLEEHKWTNPL